MRTLPIILIFSVMAIQCRKSNGDNDCKNYRRPLKMRSVSEVQQLLQPILLQVGTVPMNSYGVTQEQMKLLVKLMNEHACDAIADEQMVFVDTNPAMLEVLMHINGGAQARIDFSMPEGELLEVVNVHE